MQGQTIKNTLHYRLEHFLITEFGEMAEWLKAHAWKACKRVTVSRVRIPFSPPFKKTHNAHPKPLNVDKNYHFVTICAFFTVCLSFE